MIWIEPFDLPEPPAGAARLSGWDWLDKFGEEYQVPAQILYLLEEGFIVDLSQRYSLPAFGISFPGDAEIRIFVDHPKKSLRPGERFTLMLKRGRGRPFQVDLQTSRVEEVIKWVSQIYRRYNRFRLLD